VALSTICSAPSCPNIKPCARHYRRPFANARRSTTLYQTARWKCQSREHLRSEPQCRTCGAPASVVDHVRPHRGDAQRFWDRSNWASSCKRCHNEKTGRETRQRVGGSKNQATCEAEALRNPLFPVREIKGGGV
jgi:5-methylcytosine-specific restriction endonuclease McrA